MTEPTALADALDDGDAAAQLEQLLDDLAERVDQARFLELTRKLSTVFTPGAPDRVRLAYARVTAARWARGLPPGLDDLEAARPCVRCHGSNLERADGRPFGDPPTATQLAVVDDDQDVDDEPVPAPARRRTGYRPCRRCNPLGAQLWRAGHFGCRRDGCVVCRRIRDDHDPEAAADAPPPSWVL